MKINVTNNRKAAATVNSLEPGTWFRDQHNIHCMRIQLIEKDKNWKANSIDTYGSARYYTDSMEVSVIDDATLVGNIY